MYIGLSVLLGYLCLLPVISTYTDGVTRSLLYYLHALGVSCIIYLLLNVDTQATTDKKNEMYGLRHLLFNLELPPKTLWFNMGLWDQPGLTFPQACENLVHAVATVMRIEPNSTILDVGFGCGDSCIVLAEQYQLKVTGITNESSQYQIAYDRISSSGSAELEDQIQLLHGSANELNQHISSTEIYDYIISIDSAYHYNTRWSFLETAMTHLRSNGGVIGLYDLCIEPDFIQKDNTIQYKIFKFICNAIHIPIGNLVTVEQYEKQLMDLGYKQVEVISLERAQVFGGLAKSFDVQFENVVKYGIGISLSNRVFLKVSSLLFGLLGKKPWLVPVIVKGEKS